MTLSCNSIDLEKQIVLLTNLLIESRSQGQVLSLNPLSEVLLD